MSIKSTDIKLQTTDRIAEFKRELAMRVKVYGEKVATGTMTKYDANRRWLVVADAVKLYEKMQQKGITHHQLLNLLDDLPNREDQGRQQKLSLR